MVKIGLETHVQLETETKLFCSCRNESGDPNENVCEVCLGHPGSKPRINEEAVEQALKTSIALECSLNREFFFSRKTYFYPDMSKNFQTTQFELPVGEEGRFEIKVEDSQKQIGIKRLHIEEDPAKMVHEQGYTKVDYNRAGTPLLEIVTRPDLGSPREARAYLQQLSQVLEFLGIYRPESDFTIKSDANISIEGGERVEVKNITGTSAIEKALKYEISRQKKLKERGVEIGQQTRKFNADLGATEKMREKEEEEDYGYIAEPDLTEQQVEEKHLEKIKTEIPELPREKMERYQEKGLKEKTAEALISDPEISRLYESLTEKHPAKTTASLLTDELKKVLNYNETGLSESGLRESWISELLELKERDLISDTNAEKALREAVENPRPINEIVEELDLLKADESETVQAVERVLDQEHEAVEDYLEGDSEALNYLVGQVMGKTGGKADPKLARTKLKELIEED